MTPQFPIGSTVCHRSFVDSGGRHHDAITGLTVVESTLIEPGSIPAYYRIKAVGPDGRGYVEAAERFFDADPDAQPVDIAKLYALGASR
jgi:hypothetical protein